MTCTCGLVTETIQLCVEHHRYWLGGRQLAGVTSVIRDVLPSSYDGVDEATLENARERGSELDVLVSLYVVGKLNEIPPGTRHDVRDLFFKFQPWWDGLGHKNVKAQLTVHDDEIAGTMDIWADGEIYDLKCVSKILPTHHIQIGGYQELNDGGRCRLIHLTKALKKPKVIVADHMARRDWEVVRDFWSLKRRLKGEA